MLPLHRPSPAPACLSAEDTIKPIDRSPAFPFRRLWPRRLARLLWWLAMLAYFAFAAILLTLRYAVLPQIENYRGDIERMLSSSLNLPVEIAGIDAHWRGLLPHLALHGFQVRDQQGRPALTLDNVAADVSWSSLLFLELRLRRLEIVAPSLTVRRDAQGHVFVAGLQIDAQVRQGRNDFSDWLLAQHRIVVSDADVTWVDEMRAAPPLTLQHLNIHLQNDGRRHRFGIVADPPRALAARLDVRGDFIGDDLGLPDAWKGEAYAELDYADLAVWRQWIDYPVELSRGRGAMRLWLGVEEKRLASLNADVAFDDVRLRLADDLPQLDLINLNGRLSGRRMEHGFEIGARRLALTTLDGIRMAPSDFRLRWNEAAGSRSPGGEFSADGLDLEALARLSVYLPIPSAMRKHLADAAPRGKVLDMVSSWSGAADADAASGGLPDAYRLKARFERLGLRAQGALPGFEGLSGSIDGNQQGGTLALDSRDALLELPEVFATPRIDLSTLDARARWKMSGERGARKIDLTVEQAAFGNRDAAGTLGGRYLGGAGGPGEIDLTAHLSRGNGSAVWRYIPLAVGKEVRSWLHDSILAGVSDDTTLRLKGDLRNFPFADNSGIFEVKGTFHNATLRYQPGWPQIDNIAGELEFVGKRMLIKASGGNIYGAALSDVRAEIADLGISDNAIDISGKAAGPTADFLRFIEDSPVGGMIDHFTEDMTASGNGHLDLRLMLPFLRMADAKIDGAYTFAGSRLKIDPDLPPLTEVTGRLKFTGNSLEAERIRASILGMPMSFGLKTVDNGAVSVVADGSLNIADLRRQINHPAFDHLSGKSTWHGTVLARKKNADVIIESRLQGISSSLPVPFNKSASEALPARFERRLLPKPFRAPSARPAAPARLRDQIDVTLGRALAARFIRRFEGEGVPRIVWERGAISVGGEPLIVPDKGVLVAVNLPRIDAGRWRSLLSGSNGEKGDASGGGLSSAISGVTLKTPELIVFGHSVNDLDLRAAMIRDGNWRAEVRSREMNGELNWRDQGNGRLSGHLKQLAINEGVAANDTPAADNAAAGADTVEKMPGLDIEVDQFALHGKPFGRLKLVADNHENIWDAKLDIENDDGKFAGEGRWRSRLRQPDTQLKFSINAKNVEKLLGRFGHADAVRRGSAMLEGTLSWNGAPFALDYPSLSGKLAVEAANGQFNKLEPGVGRLLGILSLQSLPRRITLDFRDIFSEGFAFDSIAGQISLNRGVMDTQNLLIQGPAAKVMMSGSVSLPQETQDLKVRVQPAIGESLAVGAMIANPAAGAIAWLTQKILRDPIDQAFAYDYAITGTWVDPKVTKLSGPQAKAENAGRQN